MTAVTTRSVEDVLAEEITRTEARLEALRFAHSVLTGNPTLSLVTQPQPAETAAPPPRIWSQDHSQASYRRGEAPGRRPGPRTQLLLGGCGGSGRLNRVHLPVDQGAGPSSARRQVAGARGRGPEAVT